MIVSGRATTAFGLTIGLAALALSGNSASAQQAISLSGSAAQGPTQQFSPSISVSDVFLGMLRDHPQLLDRSVTLPRGGAVPLLARWPALGANLVRESVQAREVRIELVRDRFALSEAITYYEFTLDTAIAEGL